MSLCRLTVDDKMCLQVDYLSGTRGSACTNGEVCLVSDMIGAGSRDGK